MENLQITLAQINIEPNNFAKNLKKVESLIIDLPNNKHVPHILLLPELWSSGFTPELERAVNENELIFEHLKSIAKKKNLVIGGTYIHKLNNQSYTNCFKFLFPSGKVLNAYHKIHLFSQMNEVKWFQPGNRPMILRCSVPMGLAICYDLRFPELFRNYAKNQVLITLLPAQWPLKRINHFEILAQARAIENQMVFVTVNAVGKIGNTMFGGKSVVYNARGEKECFLSEKEEEIQTKTIDITDLKKYRQEFPVLSDMTTAENIEPQIIDSSAFLDMTK